jgi:hypothetical protein
MLRIITILAIFILLANAQPTMTHTPFSTFMTHLQEFARTRQYAQLIEQSRSLYQENGYYIDPRYIPYGYNGSRPPCTPSPTNPNDPCFDEYYYSNGYAKGGYDRQSYDQLGYNFAGYNRNGYSRRLAKRGENPPSSYDQNGYFQNPNYQSNGYHVIFDNYGHPYSGNGNTGPVRPSDPCYSTNAYDILVYDAEGYDQYGNNEYGDPRPPTTPPCPFRPPDNYSNIPDVGLICNSSSEIKLANGKYRFIRKSASAMSLDDWQRFRSAWNNLVVAGEIGRLAVIHSQNFNQHQSPRFLPWHREFAARLEDALHRIDPCVFLPYWDVVGMGSFPQGLADTSGPEFPPDVIVLNSNGQVVSTNDVTTAIGINGILPNAGLQTAVLSQATFSPFTSALESFHDQIHVYVGGSLLFLSSAPRHPIFYLLHANVDRLWHIWQQTHAGQPTIADINSSINPLVFGAGDSRTYSQVSNINNVQTLRGDGYVYMP